MTSFSSCMSYEKYWDWFNFVPFQFRL